MTIKFLANTSVNGRVYVAGESATFAAVDEYNQFKSGNAIYSTPSSAAVSNAIWDKLRRGYEISRFNNPHTVPAMGYPPTVTLSSTQPLNTPKNYTYTGTPSAFYWTGGNPEATGAGSTWCAAVCTVVTGGNCGTDTAHNSNGWRIKMIVDSIAPTFRVLNSANAFRFVVNGQYVNTVGTIPSNGGTSNFIQLDFTNVGGRQQREIWVESTGGGQSFVSAHVGQSETIQPVPTGLRGTVIGDSIAAGTIGGGGIQADGFTYVLSEALGVTDIRCSGVGGQGVIHLDSGSQLTGAQRLTIANNANAWTIDAPSSDVFIVAFGTNDVSSGYSAIVSAYVGFFNQILTQYPTTPIIVVGCPANNSGPAETNVTADFAIQAAVAQLNNPLVIYVQNAALYPTPVQTGKGNLTAPTTGTMTATGSISAATSCTLTVGFVGATGNYTITFSDGTKKQVTLTNASTAVSWSGAVTATATILYNGQAFSLTLTGVLAAGATSGTLSSGFGGSTGTFLVTFSSGEVRSCALTNGSTAISWTNALLFVSTTALTCIDSTTGPGNSDLYYNAADTTHPAVSGHKMLGLAYADAIYNLIKGF